MDEKISLQDPEKQALLSEQTDADIQETAASPATKTSSGRTGLYRTILAALFGYCLVQNFGSVPRFRKQHNDLAGYMKAYSAKDAAMPAAKVEELFLSIPSNTSALAASRSYTGFAHTAGKPGDFRTAVLVKQQYEELLGLPVTGSTEKVHDAGSKQSKKLMTGPSDEPRVWIDTYYVLLNHPVPPEASKTGVTLKDAKGKLVHKAKLAEDVDEQDPTSKTGNSDVPPFHGYSKAGTAEGQLVYAHFGMVEDFERLKEAGVDMKGKIALVRYGGNFRGLKVKAAQEAGAAGVLIYSDPSEDGDITAEKGYEAYPAGPARQPSSLQRGSVQYLSQYPGDPTTPGQPSYKNVKRVKPTSIPEIPSLPLSYEDALPLLKALNDQGPCFEDWKGGLGYQGASYCSGPSEGQLSMTNDVTEKILPIWNTYAVIPGHLRDEVVLIGNHRDAWVFGASDPNSGTATMHEIVKAFGEMSQKGWKPLRTIIIASWDAEEYGLVGSTEMAEDYAEWSKKIVTYLNVDGSASGSGYHVKASPSLADLFIAVSDIAVPPEKPTNETLEVGPLGSGSDYTSFLQHLGIASADLGYSRTSKDPVYHYHSIYDSEYWMEKYGDPDFHRHVNVAKALGLATLRLADETFLPLNITRYAIELGNYLEAVKKIAHEHDVTSLDYTKISHAVRQVQAAAFKLDKEIARVQDKLARLGDIKCQHKRSQMARKLMKQVKQINSRKSSFERGFISQEGLPKRPWYKHLAVAPGLNLGYGSTTYPAVTEAITIFKDEAMAQQELERLSKQLSRSAFRLNGAHKRH